jgi:hypothetical protein
MTDTLLRQHLYIGLSFLAALLKDNDFHSLSASNRVLDRAQKISDFCNLYAPNIADMPAVQLVNEAGAEELDKTIEAFVNQRREKFTVTLPDDEATLLKLYDRLQQRAARRVNRLLFASMSKADLKKHVMSQIDGEIEELGVRQ